MAKQPKEKKTSIFKMNRKISQNLDLLQSNMNDIYQDTYFNNNQDINDEEKIRNDIDDSINSLRDNNYQNISIGNMTKIYTKLALKNETSDKKLIDSISVFNDELVMDNIVSTWMENKWIRDLDYEIDMVLKYMPKLKEALNCKKDCVLSADHFSKEFISFHNTQSRSNEQLFNQRMEEIKRVYKLPINFEEWYERAQKYGEEFVYIAPYNKVFKDLLSRKQNTITTKIESAVTEQVLMENGIINESILSVDKSTKEGSELFSNVQEVFKENFSDLKVSFNKSGLLLSAAKELEEAQNVIKDNKIKSLKEIFTESVAINEANKAGTLDRFADKTIPDDLKMDKSLDDPTASEMIIGGTKDDDASKISINVPGCIVKRLDRANIIPIYIEELCLGYYYFEFRGNELDFDDPNSFDHSAGLNTFSSPSQLSRNVDKFKADDKNKVINYLAGELSNNINSTFINANPDIKKELYTILKHNELFNSPETSTHGNIYITFLPAEDVHHIVFNRDPVTHRGISDLAYSLFPAKLYSCLYITDMLGRITRGQDKRIYYVKQNVEANISQTMLNVINQIKKGNMGARQMENLSNVLNITGRFNDFLVPVSQGGDQPIQFDIMQGQQFSDNSELMNALEKMAIDPTEVPFDLIEARQSLDYAIQATMSNSRLMRSVYKRQDIVEDLFSDITSCIYNYEYNENEMIEMSLPAPAFLNMTNGAQLINGTVEYINTLTELELAGESDEVKNEFRRLGLRYYLPSHININMIDKLKERAKLSAASNKVGNEEE